MRISGLTCMVCSLVLPMVLIAGCGSPAGGPDRGVPAGEMSAGAGDAAVHAVHDHGGWWCTEHGVPEDECSLCSSEAAESFKLNGDWCQEHQRAASQCFLCDPSRAEKFAKLYEAKFGGRPPERTE